MNHRAPVLCLMVGAAWLAGCRGASPEDPPTLRVFAASSLTEAFQEMERSFETAHPDVDVSVAFSGSQVLRLQIEQGAAADVFASANLGHMQALVDAGWVHDSRIFAHNELVVIVPLKNPAGLRALDDLPRAERLVIGTAEVPVGAYTREVLRRAAGRLGADFEKSVLGRVVSEENNVRLLRARVELGEADAAIVYRTDAEPSRHVTLIPIAADLNIRADYVMGTLSGSQNPELADRWLAFVHSPRGRQILSTHGFEPER